MHPATESLKRKLATRLLVDPTNITEETIEDEGNYLPFSEMNIGLSTLSLLKKLLNEGDINQADYNKVFQAARAFYKSSLKYILKKMTPQDFWINAVWIDFFERKKNVYGKM